MKSNADNKRLFNEANKIKENYRIELHKKAANKTHQNNKNESTVKTLKMYNN